MIGIKKYKIGRRLGVGVFDKCQTPKFAISLAKKAKVKKGRGRNVSSYGVQLIEKQKVRYTYGLREKQFYNYVKKAVAKKGSNTVDLLYDFLESRLDNIIYRLGFAPTRATARQMVTHGHFKVNDRKVSIPSFNVKEGDLISIREGSKNKKLFENLDKRIKNQEIPVWLKMDINKFEAEVKGKPKYNDPWLDLHTVIEFYSR